eukprot:GHVL01004489.1.p1 GENE.GHVL01004489.1~~GHVL01004489.1.p1  ORF type:complete len:145 (+),score=17.74 GHVL01004489.1:48-482(+)
MGNCGSLSEDVMVNQVLKWIVPKTPMEPVPGITVQAKSAELSNKSNVDDQVEISLREFKLYDVLMNSTVTADLPLIEETSFDVPILLDVTKSLTDQYATVNVKQIDCSDRYVSAFLGVPEVKETVACEVSDLINAQISKRVVDE